MTRAAIDDRGVCLVESVSLGECVGDDREPSVAALVAQAAQRVAGCDDPRLERGALGVDRVDPFLLHRATNRDEVALRRRAAEDGLVQRRELLAVVTQEDFGLAREVAEERRRRHVGAFGDLLDGRRLVALFDEQGQGRILDRDTRLSLLARASSVRCVELLLLEDHLCRDHRSDTVIDTHKEVTTTWW